MYLGTCAASLKKLELHENFVKYPSREWPVMNVYYFEAQLLIVKISLYGLVYIVIKVEYKIYWQVPLNSFVILSKFIVTLYILNDELRVLNCVFEQAEMNSRTWLQRLCK